MIGVVGGVGPYAGLDLVRKVFDQTAAGRDQEHVAVSLLSVPERIADRTEFLLGKTDQNPADAILGILIQLETIGASVAGIPCNTTHAPAIFDRIRERLNEAGSGLRLVNMIEETIDHLRASGNPQLRVAPISTLGTYRVRIYLDGLARAGFGVVDPGEAIQQLVHDAIYNQEWGIKAQSSPVTPRAREALETAIRTLQAAGAQAIVLGCTELPLALPEPSLLGVPLIDPATILARALIREAAPEKLLVRRSSLVGETLGPILDEWPGSEKKRSSEMAF